MNNTRVLILGDTSYESVFVKHGWSIDGSIADIGIRPLDLICFTGGTDVSPDLYGEDRHPSTQSSDRERDTEETEIFNKALKHKIPMVGICRGAQFLCVMNGGSLIQDVTGHCQYHEVYTSTGETLVVSSSHHQMMKPARTYHRLLAASSGISLKYEGFKDGVAFDHLLHKSGFGEGYVEPEVIHWPLTRSLGHQPHPEWMDKEAPYVKYFFHTIEKYLGVK